MKKNIYTIHKPKYQTIKVELFGHYIYEKGISRTIVPVKFKKQNINPKNFLSLKKEFKIENILIFDRTKPCFNNVCIIDHVNRSGFNFFIGAEKVHSFPMFPDMSKVYKPIKGLRKILVHTVGPSRFTKDLKDKQILSESAGLISPLWHYIGVEVFCQVAQG